MALITDPDSLNQNTEVIFDVSAKTIELLEAGNLDADGVTIKAVYSFTKEQWKDDATLIKYDFPFTPITDEFFILKDGWNWKNQGTRNLIRRGGFQVTNSSGEITEHWAGIAILGSQANDQIYYDIGAGPTNFTYLGNTAEVVQVLSDPNGDGSYADGFDRASNLKAFNRQQGQLFSASSTQGNGEANLLAPKLFSLTLNTGSDLNISQGDAVISSQAPYSGMSITYHASPQARTIGGASFNFGIVIDGNNGTAEEIYEFVQYQLRQNSDIDSGSSALIGQLAGELLQFIGGAGDGSGSLDTLTVANPEGGGSGVYIDNFQAIDTNRITFTDNTEVKRTFPFVSAVTINFNSNLENDPDAIYRVFFTDANGNNFGDSDALLVQDNSGSNVSGVIGGTPSLSFDFDYDGNTQGGRTPGTDASIKVVALGLASGQYVQASGVITRSTTNAVSLVAPLERNYENAA